MDHPNVQLMLLEYCLARKELFEEYKDIIEIYFLWSFYCETISFAGANIDAFIPLEYFANMQSICKSIFPNWRSNPHLSMVPDKGIEILESIEHKFDSQKELNQYIYDVKDYI